LPSDSEGSRSCSGVVMVVKVVKVVAVVVVVVKVVSGGGRW
jgi:hypothetical protein